MFKEDAYLPTLDTSGKSVIHHLPSPYITFSNVQLWLICMDIRRLTRGHPVSLHMGIPENVIFHLPSHSINEALQGEVS